MISMATPTRNLIRWTPAEQTRVIDDAAYHLSIDNWRAMPPSHDIVACQLFFAMIRKAIERQLPPERRRKLMGRHELSPSFTAELLKRLVNPPTSSAPYWAARSHEQDRVKAESTPPVAPATTEDSADLHVAEIPATSETAHRVLVSVSPTRLKDFTDDELFAETQRRFGALLSLPTRLDQLERRLPTPEQFALFGELAEMQKLILEETSVMRKEQDRFEERVREFEQEMNKLSTAVGEAPKAKLLPRIAILGCRRYEMEHIRQGCEEVGLKLDFRHYDQDEKPKKIHADYAISLKWLNHSWDNQIKDCIANGKYVFLNGGVGMAVNQLKTWFQ